MKIKAMAYEYDVVFVDNMIAKTDDVAEHDPYAGTISLDTMCKDNKPENDIMHEVFESGKWQLEMKIDHRDLNALSNFVCAVLRDNPKFTRMFLDGK